MEDTGTKKTFGELLIEFGLVTAEDIEQALVLQHETGDKLGEVLVSEGKLSEEDIEWVLSKQLDIPFIIVDETTADLDLILKFPKDFLMINRIIPMYESADEIAIATDDPLNADAFKTIEEKFSKLVSVSTAHGESIDAVLAKVLKQEGSPELISIFEKQFERLQETCFYRVDIMIRGHSITINAFGFGILKNIYGAELAPDENFTREDVFTALNAMGIGFLYEEYAGVDGEFFSIYPMGEEFKPQAAPAVLGIFGLAQPEEPMFTDIGVYGLDKVYTAPGPVAGYDFFTTREYTGRSEQIIYTIDSAPAEFRNCYLKTYVPQMCPSCGGGGCQECKHLGLLFKLMDGIFSYNDIMTMLKQV
jgi:type IV pilus assembly protein PilB